MSDFVHLHLHSEYSLLDSACRIRDIVRAAKAAGHTAVALTDRDVLYGAVEFYSACEEEGLQPVIGCEISLLPDAGGKEQPFPFVLLVCDRTGYRNLCRIVSGAFFESRHGAPCVRPELLSENREGLIALSGGEDSYIARCILENDYHEAERYAVCMDELFGRDFFYLELQDHGTPEEKKINAALAEISQKRGIPMAATNGVHYLKKEDAEVHAVLSAIRTGRTVRDGRLPGYETDERYYKSTEEMNALFSGVPQAIENTVRIAGRCRFAFTFGKTFLPRFTPPDGKEPKAYLRELTKEGLERRLQCGDIRYDETCTSDDYKYRIEYELVVIGSMGYAEYFLIVSDFVNYAKSQGIPTGPGRGSGAGSLIAYLIGITEVDPVRYKLLFESFLNPQRISMPDFDIDFCYDRRDEVIRYVTDKYGADHVAQIVTFGTLAARAAIRDVGRALGMAYADVDAVACRIPRESGLTLRQALELEPGLREIYAGNPEVKRLIDTAEQVEGMPRHASTHAAGVVITDLPLTEYLPLSKNGDVTVTQYDMDTVARLGLLKFDFLALRYLTIIDNTAKLVRETDRSFDLKKIPYDDEETFRLISAGQTGGVFQLESAGMRQLLSEFQPRSVGDIMVALALYRPGPMDSVPVYLENRRHPEKIRYCTDKLRDILDETAGCIVYQEQVMQIFRVVAGYSYGKADIVRRAIAKKKAGVIEKEYEGFVTGAKANGVSEEDAGRLFGMMTDFSNYGFKKSHAAAYAILSYQTAYLKTHYPVAYYASLLTSVRDSPPKMTQYIAECAKLEVRVLPPDINRSRMLFAVEGDAVRFGLLALKGVGVSFVRNILSVREAGEFRSFYDFVSRMASVELNRKQIEVLIKAGAFDRLGNNRSQLLAAYEQLLEMFAARGRGSVSGQMDFFGSEHFEFTYPAIPEMPLRSRLQMEKECTDMYLSGQLLDSYSAQIEAMQPDSAASVLAAFADPGSEAGTEESLGEPGGTEYREGLNVVLCGIVGRRVDKSTKSGEAMAFVTLQDRFADMELVVFPKVLLEYQPFLRSGQAISVLGSLSLRSSDSVKVILRAVCPLLPNERFHPETFRNPFAPERGKEYGRSAVPDTGSERKPEGRSDYGRNSSGAQGTAENANVPEGSNPETGPGAVNRQPGRAVGAGSPGAEASGRAAAPTSPEPDRQRKAGEAGAKNAPTDTAGYGQKRAEESVRQGKPGDGPKGAGENDRRAPVLYLRVPDMESGLFRRVWNLIGIFDGVVPIVFYDSKRKKYERVHGVCVDASSFVLRELSELLGEENVILR